MPERPLKRARSVPSARHFKRYAIRYLSLRSSSNQMVYHSRHPMRDTAGYSLNPLDFRWKGKMEYTEAPKVARGHYRTVLPLDCFARRRIGKWCWYSCINSVIRLNICSTTMAVPSCRPICSTRRLDYAEHTDRYKTTVLSDCLANRASLVIRPSNEALLLMCYMA